MSNPTNSFLRSTRLRATMAVLVFVVSAVMVPVSHSAMVPTEQVLAGSDGRGKLAAYLARDKTVALLRAYGVDPLEAEKRVAALSDAEAARLATEVEGAPAGGAAILFLLLVAIALFFLSNDSGSPVCDPGASSC